MRERTQEELASSAADQRTLPPAPAEAPVIEAPGRRQLFRALRHRNFRLFCFGQILSLSGTWMQNVALNWLIYRLTRSEFFMGVTYFCLQMPVFLLAPLGGLAADRRSRHRIIVTCQSLLMVQALALAALTLSGRIQVWHVLALSTALGCISSFDMPARQSFLIQMTSRDDLLNAISLNSSIFNAARIVGPGIAAILVHRLGEGACFLINGISFVPVIGSLLAMRVSRHERPAVESPWEHLLEGFHFAHRTLHIRYLLLLMAAATITGAPALVLLPFFAEDILGRGSQGLGVLMASMGVGALIGTLVLAGRSAIRGLVHVVLLGSLGFGTGLILLALSRSFYLSAAIMLLIGFSALRHMASTNTLIQSLIPDHYRGRIMAMYTMTVVGLGPLGSLLAGAVAHRYGAPVTVGAGGALCLLASLVFRARLEEFRRSARQETER